MMRRSDAEAKLELECFDWSNGNIDSIGKHDDYKLMRNKNLLQLNNLCYTCVMCELGRSYQTERGVEFDPHVFSNLNRSKWMIIGQNPGFDECQIKEPFVGKAGKLFNKEIEENGVTRSCFYISNCVKCHSPNNSMPSAEIIKRCKPILMMELEIIKPKLIITLGAPALKWFCPELKITTSVGRIHKSTLHDYKIYPIFHPSPRNMTDKFRRRKFKEDIKRLCKLIKKVDCL